MMIHSMYRDYTAEFCGDYVERITALENTYFVIDGNVLDLYKDALKPLLKDGRFYVLEAIETNKTVQKALEIIDELIKLPTRRNTRLVAIGGGITQDVCCFIASVLYRGIDWFFVPTTLLAQTDSCIGSKSSINYNSFKNLIGTFYPPTEIYIDTSFVNTLTFRDYLSGLGEIYKVAVMRGKADFYAIREATDLLLARDAKALRENIDKTLAFKKSVIEVDEFDRDYRNIMNYGHTFGHALEAQSDFGVPHGQGVTVGMMIANEISLTRGLIDKQYHDDMLDLLPRIIQKELLTGDLLSGEVLLPAMRKDKKFQGKTHTCILVDEERAQKYTDVTEQEITAAISRVRGQLLT